MIEILDGYKVYKEAGVAALFILMYALTVVFLIRTLIADRSKEVRRTEKLAEVIFTSSSVLAKNTEILAQLKDAIEKDERKSSELLTLLISRNIK